MLLELFGEAPALLPVGDVNMHNDYNGCYLLINRRSSDCSNSSLNALLLTNPPPTEGISEVKTTMVSSSLEREGTKEVVFSCSTTGRPPPTIDWAFSDDHFLVHQTEVQTMTNDDGTFTRSQNISLRVPPGQSGHVDYLINRGMAGERRERLTFSFSIEQKTPEEGMCEPAVYHAALSFFHSASVTPTSQSPLMRTRVFILCCL